MALDQDVPSLNPDKLDEMETVLKVFFYFIVLIIFHIEEFKIKLFSKFF